MKIPESIQRRELPKQRVVMVEDYLPEEDGPHNADSYSPSHLVGFGQTATMFAARADLAPKLDAARAKGVAIRAFYDARSHLIVDIHPDDEAALKDLDKKA